MDMSLRDLSAPLGEKTRKTGEIGEIGEISMSRVSNEDFLGVVFSSRSSEERAIVASFRGNPHSANPSSWGGEPWPFSSKTRRFAEEANAYFTVASFRPDEKQEYRRRKKSFCRLLVLGTYRFCLTQQLTGTCQC